MLTSLQGQLRVLTTLALLSPATAVAQEAAPAGTAQAAEPPGKMHIAVPAPPPPMQRSARVHNGFYLRGGVGAGGMWPNLLDRSESPDAVDMDGSGFVFEVDALVGGSPADGFAVGGGLFYSVGPVDLKGGEGLETNVGLFMLGPFFDAFPNPKEGWHLGAMFGLAAHTIPDHPSGIESTRGLGGAAWFGYDWWVSHEISAGAMLKFNGAITSRDDGDSTLRASSTGFTFLLTALYH